MKLSFVVSSLALGLGLAHSVAAQDGPERRRRYYSASARAYYRGPVRFTVGGGAGFYYGDLAGSLSDNFPGPSFSLGVLYLVRPRLILGAEGTYFQLGAKDQLPAPVRGLAFRSRNVGGTTFLRFELLKDESEYASPKGSGTFINPYLKAGVGLLLFDPKSYYGTTRPESTTSFERPERNDYPAVTFTAPVGLGITFRLTPQLNATAEAAYYFTTSDHLDDVSARGNPAQNDGYGLAELKLEYAPWGR